MKKILLPLMLAIASSGFAATPKKAPAKQRNEDRPSTRHVLDEDHIETLDQNPNGVFSHNENRYADPNAVLYMKRTDYKVETAALLEELRYSQ